MHELRSKMNRSPDDLLRNDTIAQNVLRVIDVVQKQIQRRDALHQSALDQIPLLGRNDPGHEIKWKNPLGSLVVVVDRKSDPLTEKSRGGQRAFSFKYVPFQFLEAVEHLRVMGRTVPGAANISSKNSPT